MPGHISGVHLFVGDTGHVMNVALHHLDVDIGLHVYNVVYDMLLPIGTSVAHVHVLDFVGCHFGCTHGTLACLLLFWGTIKPRGGG